MASEVDRLRVQKASKVVATTFFYNRKNEQSTLACSSKHDSDEIPAMIERELYFCCFHSNQLGRFLNKRWLVFTDRCEDTGADAMG